ncbi:MAG: AAA family ATPase [Chloroflexi bacterium]|nr:AAA family ATPase [Chloroflexota bacterium]
MARDLAGAPCRIVLIGMMGSGKSTIGRLLADATGWPYLDNDELVRRAQGATARQIAARDGEEDLRAAESAALAIGLEADEPCVVGVAAGTVLDEADRRRMRDAAIVVWLDADPATLARRAAGSRHRPWLDGDAETWMRRTLDERLPLYRSVADIHVDTGSNTPQASVDAMLDALDARSACRRHGRASRSADTQQEATP